MTELQQRNAAFTAFLDTLNEAQRRAVDQVEGAVLVVAGPGTGKTQLLSARIGNILLKTDARPQNILCLTFTDAGAQAMRKRLLQFIGPEAYRVPVFTFHAFANRVIQENGEFFGKAGLEPVSELERIEMIRQLLSKVSPESPLRAGKKDIFQYETHLKELFNLMKKEAWQPGFVIKKADEFIRNLPQHPDFIYQRNTKHFKKGDLKTAQAAAVTQKLELLKAAADLYPKYLHAMERAARYDYEDMLLWVTRAFEQNEALLLSYQERYQYLLVDEFQDTNGAQFHLLQQLLDFWEQPNVLIVGDDDQSIYEFQGARLENLREFARVWQKGLLTIVLEDNYRSTQALLDTATQLIRHNQLRAIKLLDTPLEKNLRAALHPGGALPQLLAFPNRVQETVYAAQTIRKWLDEGVAPAAIAVLYARHKQAENLIQLLEKQGINCQTKRPVNILDLPLIEHLRQLLGWLNDESKEAFSGDWRLFRLLHALFWKLPELDLARLALHMRAPEAPQGWRLMLSSDAGLRDARLEAPEQFVQVGHLLNNWVSDVHNLPLPQLIERIVTQSGMLSWALEQPDKLWYVQVLHTFMEFVAQESTRRSRLGLDKLLDLLGSMDDNQLSLPLQQVAREGEGVQFLTAHAAKGLEFDRVILIDATEDTWDKSGSGGRGRFYLPESLTRSGEEDELEARRRLFYVAMTRAKSQLLITFAQQDAQGKALRQSRFPIEAGLSETELSVEPAQVVMAQARMMLDPEQPALQLPESEVLNALLADFSLSVKALNRYLRCPLAFYYEDILKAPAVTGESAAFGLAMHGALQQFVLRMKNHSKLEWPAAEQLTQLFVHEMERMRGFFSENGYTQRLLLGKNNLRRIHVEQIPFWRKRVVVERRLDRVEWNGIPLTGILDKIEWLDGAQLRIVDYKTGTPDTKKTAAPGESQPLGGEYWRQLAFYQLLLTQAHIFPEKVVKTAINWLEADKAGHFPIHELQFSATDMQFMEKLIRDTYDNIQARSFSPGCGKKDCAWCRLQEERNTDLLLQREREEGLDDD